MTIRRAHDPRPLTPAQAWITRIAATALGFGYLPVAPGTAGTVLPCAVMLVWQPERSWAFLAVALVVFLVGVVVASWGERLWQGSDPGHVCIDEVAGYMVSVAFVPAANEVALLVVAFFVFRVFDILKPPPGRISERLPHGWGIMADDVVAGLYSNLVLHLMGHVGWL